MYNQGMNFDIENTTWWKQDGSDHFKVRSVFFDGTGMSIQTYDGRMINGDILRDYIQSETPINASKTPPVVKVNKSLLMQGISEEELGDVFTPVSGGKPDQKPATASYAPLSQPSESTNDIIIKRMTENLGYPEVSFEVRINICPEYVEKLKTSAQVMGVDLEDIKNYFCKNIREEDIQRKLYDSFSRAFDKYFGLPNTDSGGEAEQSDRDWFEDDSFNI
jgi:hypothetical protein